MVHAIILTSLPIAIYAILQRAGLDPLPWGGKVENRVAGNMGNAIFIAAYVLMAFFLTLQRLLVHFGRLLQDQETKRGLSDAVMAGGYLFILVLQILTMIYTKSRGPFLGLGAGLFVFGLIGLLGLRAWASARQHLRGGLRSAGRWLWVLWIGLAAASLVFLAVFNLPSSPLEGLRSNPTIGRLGTALDSESKTAHVRTLIWQGVTELVPPHAPLEYPSTGGQGDVTAMTPDRVNVLRPLIGYGPETMWVAFNRYYPPDLAHYESRNASPDRSHNETFDSLVITGVLGFIAYMVLFMSVFYYCLKWLGLISSNRQRTAFLATALLGATLVSLGAYLVQGNWIFLGVALPAGLILGILLYITVAAIRDEASGRPMHLGRRELLILTILATVIAHFVEIHFGIAIAATRTYFWMWSAVLVVTGMGWLRLTEPEAMQEAPAPVVASSPAPSRRSRKRRKQNAPAPAAASRPKESSGLEEVLIYAVMLGIILFTLAYDYTVNPNVLALRDSSAFAVLWHAFTSRVVGDQRVTGLGILWLVVFTWLLGLGLTLAGLARIKASRLSVSWLGRAALLYSAVSGSIFLVTGLVHAGFIARDARQQQPGVSITLQQLSDMASSHIVTYYVVMFLLLALLGVVIWRTRPGSGAWLGRAGWLGPLAGVGLTVVAVLIIGGINVSLVRADIVYKQGQAYDSARRYDEAIFLYQQAIKEEPSEDYYYLFLGRAQLERARQSRGSERETYLRQAQQSLLKAQELNPLNTDHTANLGRLYLAWAQMVTGAERQELIQKSLDYYQVATRLSPNAAHLHNEYGTAYQVAGDDDKALEQFQISLSLDQQYGDTYKRLGDLYRATDQPELAIDAYQQGLALDPQDISLNSNLGYLYAQQGDLAKAIEYNEAVIRQRPNDLASLRNLALLYQQAGDLDKALASAQKAAELTQDDSERAALQSLIDQLQAQLGS